MRKLTVITLLMVWTVGISETALAQARADGDGKESPYKVETLKKGTSSWLVQREAKKSFPLERLGPSQRQRATAILNSVSHFRQLPKLRFEVEPSVYQYFTTHPDAAVSIWRSMDISKFKMTETSPRVFEADAGDGSRGVSDILYQTPNECVILCDGIYKNPLLIKPILAKGLVHMTTSYVMSPNRKPAVVHRANVFIMFPSTTVKTAARVISPLTNSIMDRNFHEVSIFVQMMSMAMQRQPGWVQKIVRGMDGVPKSRQTELMTITRQIRAKSSQQNLSQSMVEPAVSVEQLTQPLVVLPLRQEDITKTTNDGAGHVRLSSGTQDNSQIRTASQRTSALPVVIPGLLPKAKPEVVNELP